MKTTTIKRHSVRYLILTALGAAMSLTFGMSTVNGDLLFSDSFQYPAGPLSGDGPPAGSPPGQSGWTGANPQVIADGLSAPRVFSAPGAATFSDIGTVGDEEVAFLSLVHKGVVWIGFLIQDVNAASTSGYAVLGIGYFFSGYGLIANTGAYGIDNNNGQFALTSFGPSPGQTDWLVVKLDFRTLTQYLYVNPSLNGPEPLVPDATLPMPFYSLGQIRINVGNNNGSYAFDEVRIATTFREVRRGQ